MADTEYPSEADICAYNHAAVPQKHSCAKGAQSGWLRLAKNLPSLAFTGNIRYNRIVSDTAIDHDTAAVI